MPVETSSSAPARVQRVSQRPPIHPMLSGVLTLFLMKCFNKCPLMRIFVISGFLMFVVITWSLVLYSVRLVMFGLINWF